MKKRLCLHTVFVLFFLFALGAAFGFAAEPGSTDHGTSEQAVSSEHGATWICTYHTLKPEPEYYRGRAGQLEHSTKRSQQRDRIQMLCKSSIDDQVKTFGPCPSY